MKMKNKHFIISFVVMLLISTLSASANDSVEATTVSETQFEASAESDTIVAKVRVKPTFEDFTTTLKGFGYGYRIGFTIGGITGAPTCRDSRNGLFQS